MDLLRIYVTQCVSFDYVQFCPRVMTICSILSPISVTIESVYCLCLHHQFILSFSLPVLLPPVVFASHRRLLPFVNYLHSLYNDDDILQCAEAPQILSLQLQFILKGHIPLTNHTATSASSEATSAAASAATAAAPAVFIPLPCCCADSCRRAKYNAKLYYFHAETRERAATAN